KVDTVFPLEVCLKVGPPPDYLPRDVPFFDCSPSSPVSPHWSITGRMILLLTDSKETKLSLSSIILLANYSPNRSSMSCRLASSSITTSPFSLLDRNGTSHA